MRTRSRQGNRTDRLVALVAQLDRASDFESEGREFESLRARHSSLVHTGLSACVSIAVCRLCRVLGTAGRAVPSPCKESRARMHRPLTDLPIIAGEKAGPGLLRDEDLRRSNVPFGNFAFLLRRRLGRCGIDCFQLRKGFKKTAFCRFVRNRGACRGGNDGLRDCCPHGRDRWQAGIDNHALRPSAVGIYPYARKARCRIGPVRDRGFRQGRIQYEQ